MDHNAPVLETDRLLLRFFTLEQAPFILSLLNSPGWLRYIGDRGVRTLEDAQKYLSEGVFVAYEQYGYGFSGILLKETRELIGGCGLIRRNGLDHPDIGFALLPEYEGKGYAYEISVALLAYARDTLRLPRLLGITLAENRRSIRLLEKIGLQYEKIIRLAEDQEDLMLYGITFTAPSGDRPVFKK